MKGCPHSRPDWRMCPHCLGVGALSRPRKTPWWRRFYSRERRSSRDLPDSLVGRLGDDE